MRAFLAWCVREEYLDRLPTTDALRHTCATIGQESGDHVASEYILGHVPSADDMSAVYRERMTDERLQRVTDYIRGWLFGTEPIPQLDMEPAVLASVEMP